MSAPSGRYALVGMLVCWLPRVKRLHEATALEDRNVLHQLAELSEELEQG